MSELNHPAVQLYRDTFKFCPNYGTRLDIIATVKDLELWKEVLTSWGYWKDDKWIKFNPLSVRKMLSEYERRVTASQQPTQRVGNEKDREAWFPERLDGRMSAVRERAGVYVRRDSKTLKEVVTNALRQADRVED